jgi:hypothetical protein
MKRLPLLRMLAVMIAVALVHLPATAGACAACMGDVNSKTAPAMNAAIFLLLGFVGFTLSSLAAFAIYLMNRK